MPVSFSSPPRNLFLLGSSGADAVSNFFAAVDGAEASTSFDVYQTDEIRISDEYGSAGTGVSHFLAGTAQDSNSKKVGWIQEEIYYEDYPPGANPPNPPANVANDRHYFINEDTSTSINTTLRAMELFGSNPNQVLIVVGKTGSVPWIAKYNENDSIEWVSTSNTADVEYTGICKGGTNYYVCGSTAVSGDAVSFVEKFDSNGIPDWGKSATMLGRDVVLEKITANSRDEIIAVGYLEDDTADKGYIVKIDANSGEILWDRSLERNISGSGNSGGNGNDDIASADVRCTACYIDGNDQIYVVGSIDGRSPVNNGVGEFLIKYSPEGNILWQRENHTDHYTALDGAPNMIPFDVKSDTDTEQTVVLSVENQGSFASNNSDIFISKYSKDGTLVFRRKISKGNNTLGNASLDADPSFYYVLFTDQQTVPISGTPDRFFFGRVSTSGNGLGDFQYDDGSTFDTTPIDYTIVSNENKIGRLSDGSVRNDISDFVTYPFTANKLVFDDLATPVSNKKKQMDSAGSFEYSGSPAVRISDSQESNLLGDVGVSDGTELVQNGTFDSDVSNWTAETSTISWNSGRLQTNRTGGSGYTSYQAIPTEIGRTYTVKANINSTGTGGRQDIRVLSDVSTNGGSILSTSPGNGVNGSTVDVEVYFTAVGTTSYVYTVSDNPGTGFFDNISVKIEPWLDQSGKGNDGDVVGATHNASGYWEFDGTDDYITTGVTHNPSEPFSFTFWFNLDTIKEWHNLVDMFINSTNRNFQLFVEGDGDYRIFWGNATTGSHAITSPTTVASTWYFGAFTCDGSTGTLYRYGNGTFDSVAATIGAGTYATRPLVFGRRGDSSANGFVDGNIGEFQFYKRELTAAAVFQNYNATKSKYTNQASTIGVKIGDQLRYNGLILHYDFNNKYTYDPSANLIFPSNIGQLMLNDASNVSMSIDYSIKDPFGEYGGVLKCEHASTASGYFRRGRNTPLTAGKTYTISLYFKNGTISGDWSGRGTTNGPSFSCATFSPTFEAPMQTFDKNTPVGNGWYKQIFTFTPQYSQTYQAGFNISQGQTPLGIWYLAGFQLEEADTDGRFIPTKLFEVPRSNIIRNLSSSSFNGTIDGCTFNSDGYFEFDGTNDLINLNSTLSTIASETLPASWEAWVYFNTGTGLNQTIIGNSFTGGGVLLRTTGTSHAPADRIRFVYFQNGGNGTGVDSAAALTTGWHHIVGTYNGNGLTTSNFALYIDGQVASTTDPTFGTPTSIPQTKDFGIGGIPDEAGSYYWNGKIGEVRVYNRALTSVEVSLHWLITKSKYGL